MPRRYVWIIFLVCVVYVSLAGGCSAPQSIAEEWNGSVEKSPTLFPARYEGKWGYIDRRGDLVIDFQYDSAEGFSEGLAAVFVDGCWGYIDESGAMVIAPQFDAAGAFVDGLAAIGGLGTFAEFDGFIDKTGRLVIPPDPELWYCRDFSEGLAGVVLRDGDWGFMDRAGKVVIRLDGVLSVGWFHEGLCSVTLNDWRVGYIDRSGNFVIKPQFMYASAFSGGLAVARCEPLGESRKHVIIDTTGRVVRELSFDKAYGFSEGRAPVMTGGLWATLEVGLDTRDPEESWGFVDESGALAIPTQFASVHDFRGGLAYVEDTHGKMGYIDLGGNYVWREQ